MAKKKNSILLIKTEREELVSYYNRKELEIKKMSPCNENNHLFNKYQQRRRQDLLARLWVNVPHGTFWFLAKKRWTVQRCEQTPALEGDTEKWDKKKRKNQAECLCSRVPIKKHIFKNRNKHVL